MASRAGGRGASGAGTVCRLRQRQALVISWEDPDDDDSKLIEHKPGQVSSSKD